MPYQSTWENVGFCTKWWGRVTSAEMVQLQEWAHAHSDFDDCHYAIHDFSNCESFAIDHDEVAYSAAIDGAASMSNSRIKIAIVADNTDILDAIKTYLNSKLSPYPVRSFSTPEMAREWVDSRT